MESNYLRKVVGFSLYMMFLCFMFALGTACHDAMKEHEAQTETEDSVLVGQVLSENMEEPESAEIQCNEKITVTVMEEDASEDGTGAETAEEVSEKNEPKEEASEEKKETDKKEEEETVLEQPVTPPMPEKPSEGKSWEERWIEENIPEIDMGFPTGTFTFCKGKISHTRGRNGTDFEAVKQL